MNDWEKRLYDNYVSTEQTANPQQLKDLEHPYNDKLIASHLPKDTNLAIVDLACGHGRLIYSLKKFGYSNVLGVDVSSEQVAVAHRLGVTEVKCQDVTEFLKGVQTESFDVVFLMDILEHLGKQEIFNLLDNVHKVMKNNGMVVIHVPNGAGIFGMRVRYGDSTHQNAFTQQSMQQILR
ncbi:MAG TPA: class I SAM-dependent methyltransferase, partial [Methylococcales bacterium]